MWRNEAKEESSEVGVDEWFNSFDPVEKEVMRSGTKFRRDTFNNEEEKAKHMVAMKIGRALCRMRQSTVDRNIISTGGKENDLQLWDVCKLQNPVTTFMAKNVKPDNLQVYKDYSREFTF